MAHAGPREWVLVTGAAGFIGFHVVARFLQERVPVLGIDNLDPAYDRAIKEANIRDLRATAEAHDVPFEFLLQDIFEIEPDFADGRLLGAVHLAAKTGVRQSLYEPEAYAQTNVLGTLRVLEVCRAQGIDRLLFASSSSVYGDDTPPPFAEDAPADRPLSPYAASKRAGELFCSTYAHLHGLRVAALRFFTVYGPRQRSHLAIHQFTRWIDRGEPVRLFGDGSSERGYTYIDDVVDGVWAAWRHVGSQPRGSFELFNLGGPDTVSLLDLVAAIEGEMRQPAAVIWEPEQPGDVHRTFADPSRSRAVLGYEPRVPFPEGLRRFVAWYRAPNRDYPRTRFAPAPAGHHLGGDRMFMDDWLSQLEPEGKRALVFAAGGGADAVLVRLVAERLMGAGASIVDVAQAYNRFSFDPEVVERFALVAPGDLGCAQVMRFGAVVANDHQTDGLRGKGMAIAAAIEWKHGERLIFAAKLGAGGCAALALRSWKPAEPYDFAVAVDGGGDVLTGGANEFDRVVLDSFKANWDSSKPLGLLVIGLGADVGSPEGAFATNTTIDGWQFSGETAIDADASEGIEEILRSINRLHPDPQNWRDSDEHWTRGLHVPQIVALAVRSRLPVSSRGLPFVLVPRPSKQQGPPTEAHSETRQSWPVLNLELLRTARWYCPTGI